MRGKRLLRLVGYIVFACFAFGLCLYATFPAQALGQRLAQEINRAAQGAWAVSFDRVSMYRFTGLQAHGVKVRRLGDEPMDFAFEAMRARLNVLPLFLLRVAVDAQLQLGGEGVLDARIVRLSKGNIGFELGAETLSLISPPVLPKLAGITLGGVLDFDAEGQWSKVPRDSQGKGSIKIDKASLGPGTISGFTIPQVNLGRLALDLDMDAGKVSVSSFSQVGGDIDTKIMGTSSLRPQVRASSLDACLQFKADSGFLERNPKIKLALQLAEARLRRDRDGFLHVPLSGTFGQPRVRPGLCRRQPTAAARGRRP